MMAVHYTVGKTILRQLSGFRGYPKEGPGEDYFVNALCECSVSVAHAQAIIAAFDQDFPRLAEMRETAHNLRVKYEPQVDQRKEWEKQYGPPQAFDTSAFQQIGQPREREIDRLWKEVMAFLRTTKFDGHNDIQLVPIGRCWQVAKALGYKMNSYQQAEIDTYELAKPESKNSLPKREPKEPTPQIVSQADVDRAIQERQRAAAGEEPVDRWE